MTKSEMGTRDDKERVDKEKLEAQYRRKIRQQPCIKAGFNDLIVIHESIISSKNLT